MLPLVTGPGQRLLYLGAWAPLGGLLASLLALSGALPWTGAFAVTLPLCLVYAFVCVAAGYVGRATPVRAAGIPRIAATHLAVSVISSSLWVFAGRGWATFLEDSGLVHGAAAGYDKGRPILFGFGVLAFLLASALYYALTAYDASRRAETRALELELLSREAELKSLRAQIHPHFLFNALNSISALTSKDASEARRLCLLLGDFLRRSLTVGTREAIPLDEELELATRLLAIEKVRFGARLEYDLQVDEAARACTVPALILQPLVENAITHGIASLLEGGRVRLEARCSGDRLELSVWNPCDHEAKPIRSGAGLGLANVRRRLEAFYRGDATFVVEPGRASHEVRVGLPAVSAPEPGD